MWYKTIPRLLRFNKRFSESKAKPTYFPPLDNQPPSFVSDVDITPEIVLAKLKSLDVSKSAGPDNVCNLFLRKCADVLCKPLAHLFSTSLSQNKLPQAWKLANVVPIYKGKGLKSDPANYRPISLVSSIGKIMEDIVNGSLLNHLLEHKLLHKHQFGFLPGHSSTDQMSYIHHKWSAASENGLTTTAAFLDFSNAFGEVPHAAIKHILPSFGVSGNLLAWIGDYLDNRTQRTRVSSFLSSPLKVKTGVPQGSVIAPTLFLLFIDNLLREIDSFQKLLDCDVYAAAYADDTLIAVSHPSPAMSTAYLNGALEIARQWAEAWGMKFNASKTVSMLFGNRFNLPAPKGVSLDGLFIAFSQRHCHLGFIISRDLKFNNHVDKICQRVSKELYVLRLLRRQVTDVTLLTRLFKCFILPHLEFGNIILAGLGITQANRLESLLRRAIRIIYNVMPLDPIDHVLHDIHLDTLHFRRNFALACYGFKLSRGLCPRALLDYAPATKPSTYELRNPVYSVAGEPQPTLTVTKRSTLNLAASILNILPRQAIQGCASLSSFKELLVNQRDNDIFKRFPH